MYLGRFYQGGIVPVTLRAWASATGESLLSITDASPKLTVFEAVTLAVVLAEKPMAAYEYPSYPGLFRLPIYLTANFATTGAYIARVRIQLPVAGVPQVTTYYNFEVMAGGNDGGMITSMVEVTRPDSRFLLCGTSQGRLYRRKNPRVPQ